MISLDAKEGVVTGWCSVAGCECGATMRGWSWRLSRQDDCRARWLDACVHVFVCLSLSARQSAESLGRPGALHAHVLLPRAQRLSARERRRGEWTSPSRSAWMCIVLIACCADASADASGTDLRNGVWQRRLVRCILCGSDSLAQARREPRLGRRSVTWRCAFAWAVRRVWSVDTHPRPWSHLWWVLTSVSCTAQFVPVLNPNYQ